METTAYHVLGKDRKSTPLQPAYAEMDRRS